MDKLVFVWNIIIILVLVYIYFVYKWLKKFFKNYRLINKM